MGPIEGSLIKKFFPAIRGEEINTNSRKILGHSVKHGRLGVPEPQLSAEIVYNTSKTATGELVDSLLGGSALNYIGHRACIRGESEVSRRERKHVKLAELD